MTEIVLMAIYAGVALAGAFSDAFLIAFFLLNVIVVALALALWALGEPDA